MKQMMIMLTLTLLVSSVRAEIFRDNFNDGDLKGWTFVQGAEHGGIQNGELVLSSPKAEHETEVIIVLDGIISGAYEVAVSVKISRLARKANGGATIGLRAHTPPILESLIEEARAEGKVLPKIIPTLLHWRSYNFFLGYQDINIQDIRRGLGAAMRRMDEGFEGRNKLVIDKFIGDELRAFRIFDFRLHKWYRLKITAKENRFQCFIDDTKMLDFFDETYTEGGIYLSSGWGHRAHFDDFEVQYEALSVQPRGKLTTTWGEIKSNFH